MEIIRGKKNFTSTFAPKIIEIHGKKRKEIID